jgi:hypothetical protein
MIPGENGGRIGLPPALVVAAKRQLDNAAFFRYPRTRCREFT